MNTVIDFIAMKQLSATFCIPKNRDDNYETAAAEREKPSCVNVQIRYSYLSASTVVYESEQKRNFGATQHLENT